MSNKIKNEQLGIPYGTARNRLIKSIMFDMAEKLDLLVCHQCGKHIEQIDDLSIEHKTPWLHTEDPSKLFFDLNNIAFSHILCNSGAARRDTPAIRKANIKAKGVPKENGRVIIATNLDTGVVFELQGKLQIESYGFDGIRVYNVCQGKRAKHKGHTFKYKY